jgi:hypothetical protein
MVVIQTRGFRIYLYTASIRSVPMPLPERLDPTCVSVFHFDYFLYPC